MKKVVKAIIAASAVAAVVGVGAVSYAAWSAGAAGSATTTGTTANLSLIGFKTGTVGGFEDIQPYDQDSTKTTIAAVAKTVTLPEVESKNIAKYDIKFRATSALGLDSTSKLYVKLATSTPTEVIYESDAFTTANLTTANDWYEVTTTDVTVISDSAETSAYTAYFVLVSKNNEDMGKTGLSFTLTAVEHTA